jgi:homoserine O-acetyltransferase
VSRPRKPATIVAAARPGADPAYGSVSPPLWTSDTFRWDDADTKPTYDYSRTVSPNRDLLIDALSELEGAAGGVVTNSGQSACLLALLLRPAGAKVVAPADCYGGMVALAFAARFPDRVGRIVAISAGAEPHAAATAARELQRRVVALGIAGGQRDEALSIARGLAMLTYRTAEEFAERFTGGLPDSDPLGCSQPGQYLRARGEAFCAVMTPERFLSLSASIDRHQVDPASVHVPVLVVGAESDLLVPAAQLRALAGSLGGESELHLLPSLFGHDMFLKEARAIGTLVERFLSR